MKKIVCTAIFVFLASSAFAGSSLGLKLNGSYITGGNEANYDLSIEPVWSIMMKPNVELAPSLLLGIRGSTFDRGDSYGTGSRQYVMGAGCGLFYTLFLHNQLRISTGPSLILESATAPVNTVRINGVESKTQAADYFYFQGDLGMPVNIDFTLSKRFGLRLSDRLLCLTAHYQQGNNIEGSSYVEASFIKTFSPSIMFSYGF
jgi:hypothetical protein